MTLEMYDDYDEYDEYDEMELDDYAEDDDDDDDFDDMLEAMMDDDEDDLSERRRRRRNRSRKSRGRSRYRPHRKALRKRVPTSRSSRGPSKQNAKGIKIVNKKVSAVGGSLDDVIAVNKAQSSKIGKLDRQVRVDGAIDFAKGLELKQVKDANGNTVLALSPDLTALYRGAVKSGMFGDLKGMLSNPILIGGITFLLNNPGLLKGLIPDQPKPDPAADA